MLIGNIKHNLDGLSLDEILRVSGINFPIQKRALAMRNAHGKDLLTEPLASYRAIVRQDTDYVFQVAKAGYEPHQNRQILGFMKEYCEAGNARLESVGSFKHGAVIFAMARLNGRSDRQLAGGSKLQGYALIATSHDGSILTSVKPTSVYVICWNTLMAAIREQVRAMFRLKHTTKWTPAISAKARETLALASEMVEELNEKQELLSKVKVDEVNRIEYLTRLLNGESLLQQAMVNSDNAVDHSGLLDRIVNQEEIRAKSPEETLSRLGKQILEAIIASPGSEMPASKGTLLGALNGVTYFVDHKRGRSEDSRGFQAAFGEGERLKTRALEIAMEMATKGA